MYKPTFIINNSYQPGVDHDSSKDNTGDVKGIKDQEHQQMSKSSTHIGNNIDRMASKQKVARTGDRDRERA